MELTNSLKIRPEFHWCLFSLRVPPNCSLSQKRFRLDAQIYVHPESGEFQLPCNPIIAHYVERFGLFLVAYRIAFD